MVILLLRRADCLIAGAEDCFTVVSGGDDQAVRVSVFRCCVVAPVDAADGVPSNDMPSNGVQLMLLNSCQVASAHTSAIRVRSELPSG